jgi:hypothetical protein
MVSRLLGWPDERLRHRNQINRIWRPTSNQVIGTSVANNGGTRAHAGRVCTGAWTSPSASPLKRHITMHAAACGERPDLPLRERCGGTKTTTAQRSSACDPVARERFELGALAADVPVVLGPVRPHSQHPGASAPNAEHLRLPSLASTRWRVQTSHSERSKSGRAYRPSGGGPAWQSRGRAGRAGLAA